MGLQILNFQQRHRSEPLRQPRIQRIPQRFADDVTVPQFAEHPITLLDLATHSAALPREMGDPPEGANPRAWPTLKDRWTWLPNYALPWAPGTVAAYSNVGFDFLAACPCRRIGQKIKAHIGIGGDSTR